MHPQSPSASGAGAQSHYHRYTQYHHREGATVPRLSGPDATDWKLTTDTLNTFIKQRSQDESHTPSGDINKSHWVKSNERIKCNNRTCRKKFTLTERKHHCRRCGEVFCARCVHYQRRLSYMAEYDPNGKLYQVCEVCFSDTQTLGKVRTFTNMFQVLRSTYQAGVNTDSLKYGNPTKVILQQECARLVDGYHRHMLSITHDATVNEGKPKAAGRFSFPRLGSRVVSSINKTIPDWQKPTTWMSEGPECKVCCHTYTRLEKYHNCRICGRLVCLTCSSKNLLLFVPDECDKETMGTQPRWAIIEIVGCPEVEPDKHLYLRVCHPCREKLETLQVEAYQESLQEGDETADCMARIVQTHKSIVTVQLKLESALPEYKQLINGMAISPDSPKSLPTSSQRNNMHTLAKHQGDLSDNFTLFVMKVGRLKQLKPHTSKQLKLVKSLISCKFSFYRDNMYEFRQLKKRLSEITPPEILREIQNMVDSEAINSACLCIGQLAYESLHLCSKHEMSEKFAVAVTIKESAEVCECDLQEDIKMRGKEDWQDHKTTLNEFIKQQLKDRQRRYLRPSRQRTRHFGKSYVEVFLIRRCEEVVGQIYLQLRTRCADRRFEKSKAVLAELRESLATS